LPVVSRRDALQLCPEKIRRDAGKVFIRLLQGAGKASRQTPKLQTSRRSIATKGTIAGPPVELHTVIVNRPELLLRSLAHTAARTHPSVPRV
jgi:hypothetical protein